HPLHVPALCRTIETQIRQPLCPTFFVDALRYLPLSFNVEIGRWFRKYERNLCPLVVFIRIDVSFNESHFDVDLSMKDCPIAICVPSLPTFDMVPTELTFLMRN